MGEDVFDDWTAKVSETFESFREEFVKSDKYKGLDLDFEHLFMLKTGLSSNTFNELNGLAISYEIQQKEIEYNQVLGFIKELECALLSEGASVSYFKDIGVQNITGIWDIYSIDIEQRLDDLMHRINIKITINNSDHYVLLSLMEPDDSFINKIVRIHNKRGRFSDWDNGNIYENLTRMFNLYWRNL